MLKDKEKRTIIYRTYAVTTGKIEVVARVQVEKVLRSVWQEISYIGSGRKYGTVEVQFLEITTDKLHLATPLKTEVVLLAVYLWRHASGHREENILLKVNVT